MARAFNSRMFIKLFLHTVTGGQYDADNVWVEGVKLRVGIVGVMISGNKFSQFDEGVARRVEDGGYRLSDFKNLHVKDKFKVGIDDKLEYKGNYYNVLQESDESSFGFRVYLLEKSKGWSP